MKAILYIASPIPVRISQGGVSHFSHRHTPHRPEASHSLISLKTLSSSPARSTITHNESTTTRTTSTARATAQLQRARLGDAGQAPGTARADRRPRPAVNRGLHPGIPHPSGDHTRLCHVDRCPAQKESGATLCLRLKWVLQARAGGMDGWMMVLFQWFI